MMLRYPFNQSVYAFLQMLLRRGTRITYARMFGTYQYQQFHTDTSIDVHGMPLKSEESQSSTSLISCVVIFTGWFVFGHVGYKRYRIVDQLRWIC